MWRVLAVLYVPTLLLLIIISIQDAIPPRVLLRDPNSLAKLDFYAGALSNVGIVLWAAAAGLCFFCYALLRAKRRDRRLAGFFLYAAVLTTVLAADDLFQLHEEFFRYYLPVPEPILYGGYVAVTLTLLVRYREVIAQSEYLLLFLALGFFGLSLGTDVLQDWLPKRVFLAMGGYVLEDGSKLIGIITWLAYFSRFAFKSVKNA